MICWLGISVGDKEYESMHNILFAAFVQAKIDRGELLVYPDSRTLIDLEKEWLLFGEIDRQAMFVVKNVKADEYRAYEHLIEMGEKNGFVFFKRNP